MQVRVPMKKLYLDMNKLADDCCAVFAVDTAGTESELIPAGTTAFSMPVSCRNAEYQKWAEEYDIHFIFDDNYVTVDFYTIPHIVIFAADGQNGYLAAIGEDCGPDSDAPICYIDGNRNCFMAAGNFKDLMDKRIVWKTQLQPCDKVLLFRSKEEAQKEYEFFDA